MVLLDAELMQLSRGKLRVAHRRVMPRCAAGSFRKTVAQAARSCWSGPVGHNRVKAGGAHVCALQWAWLEAHNHSIRVGRRGCCKGSCVSTGDEENVVRPG